MKQIPLTRGFLAVVDDEDYEWLSRLKWHSSVVGRNCVYAARSFRIEGKTHHALMHRMIMGLNNDLRIDHKDGNGLNNQRANLRLATATQNSRNQCRRITSSSGFKGIYLDKRLGKWIVQVHINHKRKFIGRFLTKENAATAYNIAAVMHYGDFARLNEGVNE